MSKQQSCLAKNSGKVTSHFISNKACSSVLKYFKCYLLFKFYNLFISKYQMSLKNYSFFIFCSFFFRAVLYDDLSLFYRFAERVFYFFLYPFYYFEKFSSVWTQAGKKEKFLTLWVRFSRYLLCTRFASQVSYIYFSLASFWFPFILEPTRKGRKLFRIPQNMGLRRTFRLLNHRLKKTIQYLPELSLYYNWCYLLVTFYAFMRRRRSIFLFKDYTMLISQRFISYRRPISRKEKEKEKKHLLKAKFSNRRYARYKVRKKNSSLPQLINKIGFRVDS